MRRVVIRPIFAQETRETPRRVRVRVDVPTAPSGGRVRVGARLSAFLTVVLYRIHVGESVFRPHASPLVNLGLVEVEGESLEVTRRGRQWLLERVYFR